MATRIGRTEANPAMGTGRGTPSLAEPRYLAPDKPLLEGEDFDAVVRGILNRHPAVGLAVGFVRDGGLAAFSGHGFADIESHTPITEDTVFRIASITKTFTAIAVMQLWERGLVDLDAPANDYLRAYALVPARAGFGPATVRHLLTHTAGIREVLHVSGLLRMRDLGETVERGRAVPTLAEYYRGRLRIDVEPGTRFMYTDHGFATLGQIVEDVTGTSLAAYVHENIFEPLGMTRTDLVRTEEIAARLATGYKLRSEGAEPIPDYELMTGRCSRPRRSPRCSSRSTSPTRGSRGSGSRSSEPTSAAIWPSSTTGSCPASIRRSSWRPTTASP